MNAERVIVKKQFVQQGARARAKHAGSGACESALDATPEVRLLERDGLVHALEVQCGCGEGFTIELSYPDEGESAPAHALESGPQAAAHSGAMSQSPATPDGSHD